MKMNTELMNRMTRSMNKVVFKFKKHSPEMLAVVGVVGIGVSAIMACKATLKVNDILDEAKVNVDRIHDGVENKKKLTDGGVYTQELANRDMLAVYAQTGFKFVKLYGPAVVLGVVSVGCMLGSNHILRKRNAALVAAYTAVETGFKEYRDRVIDRFGADLDRELRYNIKAKEIEETVVGEDGTESTVTNVVNVVDPDLGSAVYGFWFDETCLGYTGHLALDKTFIKQKQNWACDYLRRNRILTLNQLREAFGLPRIPEGQFAGWVYNDTVCDGYVDLGVFESYQENNRNYVNGHKKYAFIDPNCIGNVIPYM